MIFHETKILGAYLIEPERAVDERGFFARTWCRKTFAEQGLDTAIAQCSVSFNRKQFSLRGMHFQAAPYEETKLVRCTRGAIYDVLLDLRPSSASFAVWQAFELTCDNRHELHVPKGVAHGFLTLVDDTEVSYQISTVYSAAAARGVRWNDPTFAIDWPAKPLVISERDATYQDWSLANAESAAGGDV